MSSEVHIAKNANMCPDETTSKCVNTYVGECKYAYSHEYEFDCGSVTV